MERSILSCLRKRERKIKINEVLKTKFNLSVFFLWGKHNFLELCCFDNFSKNIFFSTLIITYNYLIINRLFFYSLPLTDHYSYVRVIRIKNPTLNNMVPYIFLIK